MDALVDNPPQTAPWVEQIDRARIGSFHYRILLVTGLCWLWAAYGVTVIGYLLPSWRAAWQVSSSQLGLVASLSMVGMMVGAVGAGALSDRIGRRATLELTQLVIGITLALTALAPGYAALLGLRVVSGLGLGAVLPVASTLISEYSPSRHRGRLGVLLNGFWGIGAAAAALVAYLSVPRLGWQAPLAFGGLAVLSIPLVRAYLPESLRFLQANHREAEAAGVARQIARRLSIDPQADRSTAIAPPPAVNPDMGAYRRLAPWSRGYRARTASLWLLWIALNFTFQGIFIWLPSIIMLQGFTQSTAALFTLLINLGQLPGTVLGAYLADSAGRRTLLVLMVLAWGLSALLLGFAAGATGILILGELMAVGTGVVWGMVYPVTTELYPTRMRGTATGWSTGVGRLGGIAAPYAVGLLLQLGAGDLAIFALLGAVPMLTTLGLFGLSKATTGKSLEEING